MKGRLFLLVTGLVFAHGPAFAQALPADAKTTRWSHLGQPRHDAPMIRSHVGLDRLDEIEPVIEAEKAGDHDRGFTVVAIAIRRPADRTAGATVDLERFKLRQT